MLTRWAVGKIHLCRLHRLGRLGHRGRAHRSTRERRRTWMNALVGEAMVLTALALTAVPGCQTNPVTGQSQFNLVTLDQDIAMGAEAAPQYLEAFGGQVDAPVVRQYVSDIGQRMAALSHLPDLPWRFYVVDSDVVNAFALPGGHVFVTRGLLEMFDNEAELAAVLGHEIGHVTYRHSAQQITSQTVLNVGLSVGASAAGAEGDELRQIYNIGTQVGNMAFLLPYSRRHEMQSDQVGLRYMVQAGYDPRAMVTMLDKLARAAGGARPPLFLSTHPYPEDRADEVRQIINEQYAGSVSGGTLRTGESAYQQTVLSALAKLPTPRHRGAQ